MPQDCQLCQVINLLAGRLAIKFNNLNIKIPFFIDKLTMKYEKRKTGYLWKSNHYELSKQIFGTGLEKFILKNAKKDPFLFTIENKSWEFFVFLTKKDQNFKFIEEITKRESIGLDLSLISRIKVNNFIGCIYQLLDKDHFLKTYRSTMSLYKSKYRSDIDRYRLVLGKKAFTAFYKERPIDLYKGYLEGVFSKI